jgi:hypothetical protein
MNTHAESNTATELSAVERDELRRQLREEFRVIEDAMVILAERSTGEDEWWSVLNATRDYITRLHCEAAASGRSAPLTELLAAVSRCRLYDAQLAMLRDLLASRYEQLFGDEDLDDEDLDVDDPDDEDLDDEDLDDEELDNEEPHDADDHRDGDAVRADIVELFRDRLPEAVRLELVPASVDGRRFLAIEDALDADGRSVSLVPVFWPCSPLQPDDFDSRLVELVVELTELDGTESQTIELRDNDDADAATGGALS